MREQKKQLKNARIEFCTLWRGEPPEVDFYAFWRVRLVLHVTAKGIYIPGFCTLTFTQQFNSFLYILLLSLHTFNNCLSVPCLRILSIALVLHMRSTCCSIAWFPSIVPVRFLLAKVCPPTIYTSKGQDPLISPLLTTALI
jgi:hypothetical protein